MPNAAAVAVAARLEGEPPLRGDGMAASPKAWESLVAVGDQEGGRAVRDVIGVRMLGGVRLGDPEATDAGEVHCCCKDWFEDLFLGCGLGAASFNTRDLEPSSRWFTWLADLDFGLGVPGVPGDPCGTPALAELLGVALLGPDEGVGVALLSQEEL